jgi:hypothetical protein
MRPVELIDSKRCDFSTPQPVESEQHQNGMITDIPGVIRIRLGKELLHLGPGRSCRKRLVLKESRAFNGRRDAGCTPLLVFGIPKESP